MMENLKIYSHTVKLQNEYNALHGETDEFHLDGKIPKVESNNGNPKTFDNWPAEVF